MNETIQMSCRVCRSPVRSGALFCRRCGSEIRESRGGMGGFAAATGACLLLAGLLSAVFFPLPHPSFSLAFMGFAFLCGGFMLVLMSPFLRPAPPSEERDRIRLLHALEEARVVSVPRVRPGQFIQHLIDQGRRNHRDKVAGAKRPA